MNRKISFAEGEFYHIYNRGVEKRNIFNNDDDRKRFQALLYLCNSSEPVIYRLIQGSTLYKFNVGKKIVAIGAYVLMPNHFHLLVRETTEGGITEFMRKLNTAYSMYFNKKYDRVGPLFQGTFKAEHIAKDEYLKYLFAYIHLNIIKLIQPDWKEIGLRNVKLAKEFLDNFTFSSYFDYCGTQCEETVILSKDLFPKYFLDRYSFQKYLDDWLTYQVQGSTL